MTLTKLPSGPEILLIEADFPAAAPSMLFSYWTEPALLQQWWPQQAEIEPYVGGNYHLSWPQMNWHLRGCYISFEPGKRLAFTWKWDHDAQEIGERVVEIIFKSLTIGGAQLLLSHGPYLDTAEDQAIRIEHHLAGWEHFLPRLQQAIEEREKP